MEDTTTALLGAARVDTGHMTRGLQRPRPGQAFPGKGGGRKTRGSSGRPHAREAGLGFVSPSSWTHGKVPCLAPDDQRQPRDTPPNQALPGSHLASVSEPVGPQEPHCPGTLPLLPGWADPPPYAVGTTGHKVPLPRVGHPGVPPVSISSWGLRSWLARQPPRSPLHIHVAETI